MLSTLSQLLPEVPPHLHLKRPESQKSLGLYCQFLVKEKAGWYSRCPSKWAHQSFLPVSHNQGEQPHPETQPWLYSGTC